MTKGRFLDNKETSYKTTVLHIQKMMTRKTSSTHHTTELQNTRYITIVHRVRARVRARVRVRVSFRIITRICIRTFIDNKKASFKQPVLHLNSKNDDNKISFTQQNDKTTRLHI